MIGSMSGVAGRIPAQVRTTAADSRAGTSAAAPRWSAPIVSGSTEISKPASSVVYSVGHSRNGILLAPLTAIAVAEIVLDKVPSFDLGPFSIGRFPPDTTT